MKGRLIAVVGPSGVGKDSVMEGMVRACPDLMLVQRVITREAGAGGEDFEHVSEAEFQDRVHDGAFALHWQAHGLFYGVPREITAALSSGTSLLVNLSRAVLPEAQMLFPGFCVLHLTAPREVLAQRLADRGRESADVIDLRLERAGFELPEGLRQVIEIANTGMIDETVEQALSALHLPRG